MACGVVQYLSMGVLYGLSSDLVRMEQRELRRDQHAVLMQTVHIRSTGVAKPNAKSRCAGSVRECEVW